MITSPLYRTPMYNSTTVPHRYHRYSTVHPRTYHYTCLQFTTVHSPIRSYKPYLLAYLAKHPCCARSVLYTRYLHELHGYIYTIFLCSPIYIIRNIDGHLLRLYIFMRGYLNHKCHGTAFFFGAARGHKDKTISNAFVSCFLCFVSSSRSFVNKD